MWMTEDVPHSVAVIIFCMLYKGKGKSREDLKSYRPIGLEMLVLKVLEGCLTLRLKSVLYTAIPAAQSAYLHHRSTMDNVIWVRSSVQTLNALGLLALLGLE